MSGRQDVAASQPPSISITNPPFNAEITTADTIQIQANASDTDGTITGVLFYVNGTLLVADISAPYTINWGSVNFGAYDLMTVAIDDASDRATSAVVRVTVVPAAPRTLYWSSQFSSGEWNGTAFNWRVGSPSGPPTIFRAGDSVNFNGSFNIFIASNGVPGRVAPAWVNAGSSRFQSGDIVSGWLSSLNTLFTNYGTSLSFPGGTLIGAGYPGLVYDVSPAPHGAALQFGSGPIVFTNNGEAMFSFVVRRDQTATLVNDIVTSSGTSTIIMGNYDQSNAVTRFYGTLNLNGRLNVTIHNGKTQWFQGIDAESHEWLGPVILNQSAPRNLMFNLMGSYKSKGLVISGSILDGPGLATNRLTFQDYAVPFVRLSGNNTYANGTFIGNSPSAPQAVIEVTPWSTLGTGNVEVESGGVLRLMGSQNVASNRSVIVRGRVILEPGIKVRISSLRLGGTTFTSGLFTATNGMGFLVSNGTFRLPATNLLPTIALISPPAGSVQPAGQPLTMGAAVSDVDSYIQRVDFFLNGALAGAGLRTNQLYQLSLTNPPAGTYPLHAIAYDDDGGVRTSAVVNVTVAPRISRIEIVGADRAVLDFDSPINHAYELQVSDTLSPPAWTTVTNFPLETMTRSLRVTNALPAGLTTRFYQLVLF